MRGDPPTSDASEVQRNRPSEPTSMSIRSRLASLLFAVVLVVPVAAVSPAVGAVVAASGLPACAYRDVIATARGYGLYSHTLLDTIHMVPRTYAPGDLRSTGVAGGGQLRSVAIGDLRGMFAAARRAGAALMIKSSYRSYSTQVSTFNY